VRASARASRVAAALAAVALGGAVGCAARSVLAPRFGAESSALDESLFAAAWAYRGGDCETAREYAEAARRTPDLAQLLIAHCDELALEFSRARERYRAIAAGEASDDAKGGALARLEEMERAALAGFSRTGAWEQRARRIAGSAQARVPRVIERGTPPFPTWLRVAGVEGWALVEFTLDANGRVVAPFVADSDPPFLFDAAALQLARGSRYEPPGRKDAQPWNVLVRFEVE